MAGELDGSGDAETDQDDRSLDADLRRGAELIESSRRLLGMLPGRVGDLPESRRADAVRLIGQMVDAMDELDGMLLGIAARNAGIVEPDEADANGPS